VVSGRKFFVCRLQEKEEEKRRRQRTQSCTLCVTDSQHNDAKETLMMQKVKRLSLKKLQEKMLPKNAC